MNVSQVPAQYAALVWPMVAAMVEKALQKGMGQFTSDALLAEIQRGERQLWIGNRGQGVLAMCTSKVVEHPGRRSLYVSHAFGDDLSAIQYFWPALRNFAKQWNCGMVAFIGRRGWGKSGALPPEFKHESDVWVAELT